ncbi:MAG: hypothetical protein JJ900_13150 [Rhodospirillales bacterium]|nr:hypothetical protein [Rhodospirillales bacterium]MBO6787793.1 hypothetical protein [Rhodospirillales bacterium]
MLLDPTTFKALAEHLGGDTVRAATKGMPSLPADDLRNPVPLGRTQVLLSFGLTERDLDFMGERQRRLVDEVVDRVLTVQSLA